jgi:dCMP deaminase
MTDLRFGVKWDRRFLRMANVVGSWSKDPGHKVGAVIVRPDRTVAGVGYNGYPRGVDDTYGARELKLLKTVHAEMNAILSTGDVRGFAIYVVPLFPCANCAAAIIQSGLKRVVAAQHDETPEAWREHFEMAKFMFGEAGVAYDTYGIGDAT